MITYDQYTIDKVRQDSARSYQAAFNEHICESYARKVLCPAFQRLDKLKQAGDSREITVAGTILEEAFCCAMAGNIGSLQLAKNCFDLSNEILAGEHSPKPTPMPRELTRDEQNAQRIALEETAKHEAAQGRTDAPSSLQRHKRTARLDSRRNPASRRSISVVVGNRIPERTDAPANRADCA